LDEKEQQSLIEEKKGPEEDWNLRFIKPSKDFYNKLMALWLRFDKSRLKRVTFDEFVMYVRRHSNLI
jgi:hypothetical protein